tara:strand:+ start:125 stop:436 length:312 start_codon:yes stop_codon:yes gene_type:complete
MSAEKDEILQEIFSLNFEDKFANSLQQIHNFIDQLIIESSSNEFNKETHVKNLINLKSFIDNSIFEYKLKSFLSELVKSKKKENQDKKELKNQEESLEVDQSN